MTKVVTECLGKQLEMAICLAAATAYKGPYRYGLDVPMRLFRRIETNVPDIHTYSHSAEKGAMFDFTSDTGKHISAKSTTKKQGKVAPQYIGQPSVSAFCERLNIEYSDTYTLKKYIQNNIRDILPTFEKYTFDCPIIYFNESTDTMKYITKSKDFVWDDKELTWTREPERWNNSCTLKADGTSIMEIQFHNSSRNNMANRWFFENILKIQEDQLISKILL